MSAEFSPGIDHCQAALDAFDGLFSGFSVTDICAASGAEGEATSRRTGFDSASYQVADILDIEAVKGEGLGWNIAGQQQTFADAAFGAQQIVVGIGRWFQGVNRIDAHIGKKLEKIAAVPVAMGKVRLKLWPYAAKAEAENNNIQ